jgi:hypothetical protein
MAEATFEGWVKTNSAIPPYCINLEKCNLGTSLKNSGFEDGDQVSVYVTSKTIEDEVGTVELRAEVSRTTTESPDPLKLVYLTQEVDAVIEMAIFRDSAEFKARIVSYQP